MSDYSEKFKYGREAAKITFDKISSWDELNAATLEKADENFRDATKNYWKEFAISGVLQFDPKEGKQVLRPFTDLDGRATLGVLKEAGIDTSKLTYIKPGEHLQGAINIDTGDKFGVVYEESTYTAYFDHHAPGTKEVTSTAEIVYKTMVDLGMMEKSEAMDRLIKFVTDIDNRRLPAEEFLRSGKTVLGLQRAVDFDKLLAYFKDHESPTEELKPEELAKYGLREEAEKQQRVVDEAMETLNRMEKEGKVIRTKYGQIVVNIMNELRVGASAAYVKFDGIINFTPFKSFAVTFKEEDIDGEEIKKQLGDKFQGKIIRGKMWIYNEKEPLELSLTDVIRSLSPEDESYLEKLFIVLHISPDPDLSILEPRIPTHKMPGEPEDPTVCGGDTWWRCAMLYPYKKIQKGTKLYLYIIDPGDTTKFKKTGNRWLWAPLEVRSQKSVKVIKLGEIDLENKDMAYAFSRPCGNCGRPFMYCDDGLYCGGPMPSNPLKF